MSKIPAEIDQMLWTVAEQQNMNAETEFLRRYPIYREELMRRKEAVSRLRTSRPGNPPGTPLKPKTAPRFVPREKVATLPEPRKIVLVGALALAALAAASYTVTTMLTPPPTPSPLPQETQTTPQTPPSTVVQNEQPKQSAPDPGSSLGTGTPNPAPPVQAIPAWEKPQSLAVKELGLIDVLKMIQIQSGMRVEIAPGMPDPKITVEYHDMSAMAMLDDLGRRYQFTPFDQGDGSVVIYPAVDASQDRASYRRLGG